MVGVICGAQRVICGFNPGSVLAAPLGRVVKGKEGYGGTTQRRIQSSGRTLMYLK